MCTCFGVQVFRHQLVRGLLPLVALNVALSLKKYIWYSTIYLIYVVYNDIAEKKNGILLS